MCSERELESDSLATIVKITPDVWKCFSFMFFIISENVVERFVRIFIRIYFSLDGHQSVSGPPGAVRSLIGGLVAIERSRDGLLREEEQRRTGGHRVKIKF